MPSSTMSKNKKFIGEGELSRLDTVLPQYKTILVFYDEAAFHPSGAANYFNKSEKKLKPNSSIHYIGYTGKALPIEDIEEKYQETISIENADLIIAVGGGTIIDMAKIIAIAYSNQCKHIAEILPPNQLQNKLDLIFIPTTAGTGSEATSFAVVYKDKIKLSVDNKSVLPTYVVLDPLLLKSLPESVLFSTVLDALAQAIESIWAKGGNEESKEFAARAIQLIAANYCKPITLDVLALYQWASHLAGRAINISRTTLPHSISYPISAYFGVPHGIAVFLTLPQVMELNYYADSHSLQEGVTFEKNKANFKLYFKLFGVETIHTLKMKLNEIMLTFGFSKQLRDYSIKQNDLERIAENALTKGRSDNNPRKIDRKDILELLTEIF